MVSAHVRGGTFWRRPCHVYVVERWEGGEPVALGDEHSELRWFTPRAAFGLPDLALSEYRQVFADAFGPFPP